MENMETNGISLTWLSPQIVLLVTNYNVLSFSAKKPKKGQATAKQRLGKILKIHKLGMF